MAIGAHAPLAPPAPLGTALYTRPRHRIISRYPGLMSFRQARCKYGILRARWARFRSTHRLWCQSVVKSFVYRIDPIGKSCFFNCQRAMPPKVRGKWSIAVGGDVQTSCRILRVLPAFATDRAFTSRNRTAHLPAPDVRLVRISRTDPRQHYPYTLCACTKQMIIIKFRRQRRDRGAFWIRRPQHYIYIHILYYVQDP